MRTSPKLRVPNEYRFVQALALSVGSGDCLGILLEVGALRGEDLAVVRRVKEALWPGAYDAACDAKAWDLVHVATVLTNALDTSDAQAFVAYQMERLGLRPEAMVETLARVGVAGEYYGRPWADDLGEHRLGQWRELVVQLLALAGTEGLGLPVGMPVRQVELASAELVMITAG